MQRNPVPTLALCALLAPALLLSVHSGVSMAQPLTKQATKDPARKRSPRERVEAVVAASLSKVADDLAEKKLLVVATRTPSKRPDAWGLVGCLRDLVAEQLREVGADPVIAVELEEALLEQERTPPKKRRKLDVPEIARKREVDGIASLTIKPGKKRSALRLELIELGKKRRSILKKTLALSTKDLVIDAHTPELNRKVLSYARERKGKQEGNGECWTLAANALKTAGARTARSYDFGRKLGPRDAIYPGDIVQFEKAEFAGRYGATMPHHTAIVESVHGPTKLGLIHQNFGDAGKRVSLRTIDLVELKSGTVEIYRPLPADSDGD